MQEARGGFGTGKKSRVLFSLLMLRFSSGYWGWFFFYVRDKSSQGLCPVKAELYRNDCDSVLEISNGLLLALEGK